MEDKIDEIDKIVQHWLDSADKNKKTMGGVSLPEWGSVSPEYPVSSQDYSWALFLGHLVIEKTLKALYVKRLKKHAIFSHDLLRLANKIDINLTEEHEEWLDKITTFNLNARYNNYKQDFYSLCTKDFTDTWLDNIEKLRIWLRNQL